MWTAIERARRRVGLTTSFPGAPAIAAPPYETPEAQADVVVTLAPGDLDRFVAALGEDAGRPGDPGAPASSVDPRPDSPARLERALSGIIARHAGHGTPRVARWPAGLHTPETWQVRIEGPDARTRATVVRAADGASNRTTDDAGADR